MTAAASALPAALHSPLQGASLVSRLRPLSGSVYAAMYGSRLAFKPARDRTAAGSTIGVSRVEAHQAPAPERRSRASAAGQPIREAMPFVIGMLGVATAMIVVGGTATPGGQAQLLTVLVTGITTGGLSCMVVQGGLLASTLAPADRPPPVSAARTILAFLGAKLVAYTLLGALLGLLGSMAQLSIGARGGMQIGIGIFMLATGVRMLYPHPWLNFLALEPPASVRRMIRRKSRDGDGTSTAIFLGALTVLIPCGITQAMMAIAITTSNPIAGAMVMALFTIGTSPVFFALSLAATSIGRHTQQYFNRAVGIVILILGYVAIQTGFMLIGRPLPLRPVFVGLTPASATVQAQPAANGAAQVEIRVHEKSYQPNRIEAAAGKPVGLRFVTNRITGCTRTVNIAKTGLQQSLRVTGTTLITIPAQPAGTVVRWVCGMGMYSGTVTFKNW